VCQTFTSNTPTLDVGRHPQEPAMPSTSHFWQGVPISFPTLHATHSSVEDCPCLVEVSNSGVKSKLSAQLHMLHTLCYVVHTSQSPLRAIGKQCCTLLVALYHPPSSRQPSRLQVHPQAPQNRRTEWSSRPCCPLVTSTATTAAKDTAAKKAASSLLGMALFDPGHYTRIRRFVQGVEKKL